ncbi:hypothetical protein NL676_024230 [Syzygium grande]|nr:hypothetical protein NL676_024230 [Syzygium grande]
MEQVSASKLGQTEVLLQEPLRPSLKDADTVRGGVASALPLLQQVVSSAGAPPSPDASAITDLINASRSLTLEDPSTRVSTTG